MTRVSIVRQITRRFNRMFRPGMSKYLAKRRGTMANYIFSFSTLRHYKKNCIRAIREIELMFGVKIRHLNEAGPYLDLYLEAKEAQGRSAWTLATYKSALVKLYHGVNGVTITYTPPARKRSEIKRSRKSYSRNRHFSEKKNADLVTFLRSTGLRGHREAEMARGTDYWHDARDNSHHIRVIGKGGRQRMAPIVGGSGEVARVVDMMQKAGEEKVLGKLPDACAPHRYRADYAARVYRKYARPFHTLSRQQKVVCRKDMKGKVFDRTALMKVSEALGHSRVSVVVAHYSHKF